MRGASLIILAMVLASAYSSINPSGCGQRPKVPNNGRDIKVVGGVTSTPYDWGWHVELRSGAGPTGGSLFCGGSIIDNEWIVTAAHCTVSQRPGTFRIVVGHHNRLSDEKAVIHNVNTVINHESYNSANFRNDISLVKVNPPININGDNVIPHCIGAQGEDYTDTSKYQNQSVVAIGWGTTSTGGLAQNLQEVALLITPYATCAAFYGATLIDIPTMICVGVQGDGKDTCQGDSGGSVNYYNTITNQWEHIGITSWGRGCGDIGVYSRISSYFNWINGKISSN